LANLPAMPDETSVNEYKLTELSDVFIAHGGDKSRLRNTLHEHAHRLLREGRTEDALRTLLAFNDR
jgi:hypothetical protein